MTQQHPDLVAEQAHIDYAYECLELSKTDAWKLRGLTEAGIGVGGTFQARYERDVFDEALVNRLTQLDLGSAALVFGRIDRQAEGPDASPSPIRTATRWSLTGVRRWPSRSTGRRGASRWAWFAAVISP
jgi:hypothetical protein